MPISHFIACKNYDERITTIHTRNVYDDTMKRESIQQVQKNKRILLVLLPKRPNDITISHFGNNYHL